MAIKKKICAVAMILSIVASSAGVCAKITDATVSPADKDMVFSGITASQDTVTYVITKKNEDAAQIVAGIGEMQADAEGKFGGDFQLSMSGEFVLRLKDSDGYTDLPFTYINAEERQQFIDNIKASDQTAQTINALFTDKENAELMRALTGSKFDGYTNMSSAAKMELANAFVQHCDFESLSLETFSPCFAAVYHLTAVNNMKSAEIRAAMDELNPSFEETAWDDVTNQNLKTWIITGIEKNRPYASVAALESEYTLQSALYQINTSNVAGISSAVRKYAQLLSLTENTTVNQYLSGATDSVNRALVSALTSNPAYTAEALTTAISNALKNSTSTSGSGGSGSSGGGSGRGASVGVGGLSAVGEISIVDSGIAPTEEKDLFSDINGAEWARDAITALVERNVISGYGDGSFRPNASVTREEFVKMVVTAFEIPYEDTRSTFLDVFDKDWFSSYVGAAQQTGIITGTSEKFFGVGLNITREDAAVILTRAAAYKGMKPESVRAYQSFTDEAQISGYAAEAVQALYRSGVISGMENGSFQPQSTCTRAETAKMIYGLI